MRHAATKALLASTAILIGGATVASAEPLPSTPYQASTSAASIAAGDAIVHADGSSAGQTATPPTSPSEPSTAVSKSRVWGWIKGAWRWVKKHVGFENGTPVVKGTHNVGGG
jgi:hypothetical protein